MDGWIVASVLLWPLILFPILLSVRAWMLPAENGDERLGRSVKSFFRGFLLGFAALAFAWVWILFAAVAVAVLLGALLFGGIENAPYWFVIGFILALLVFAHWVAFGIRDSREWIFEFLE